MMSTKHDFLMLLLENADDYISGEKAARKLGVSRAAIWKAVRTLRAEGYHIEAVTNRGYRLGEDNDILTPHLIQSYMNHKMKVICFPTIDSTNNEAKRELARGRADEFLITADEQTQGRGRQGKSFYSPAHTGIYMSLVLHPMMELKNAVTATTAAAVAVCRAIERLTDKEPQIKWVNDVYLDGKKICGILTEAITDYETQIVTSIIVGIGLNISTTDFPDDVENAASLASNVRRSEMIAAIADELCDILDKKSLSFLDYYRTHSMIIGQEIVFIKNGVVTRATALEIDEKGGLRVRLENGEITTLTSGEISIRRVE